MTITAVGGGCDAAGKKGAAIQALEKSSGGARVTIGELPMGGGGGGGGGSDRLATVRGGAEAVGKAVASINAAIQKVRWPLSC